MSGAKLYEPRLELRALNALCRSKLKKEKTLLLSALSEDHFYDSGYRKTYKRIRKLMQETGRYPAWDDLITDPKLAKTIREDLSDFKEKPLNKRSRFDRLLEQLDHFRKMRKLFFSAQGAVESLEEDHENVDQIIRDLTSSLTDVSGGGARHSVLTIGHEDNTDEVFERLVSPDRPKIVRTGFRDFDMVNGGFAPGTLVLIAATTGGGKSAVCSQLAMNMAERGHSVGMMPLEMSNEEVYARDLANISGINLNKYLYPSWTGKPPLTEREIKQARARRKEYIKKLSSLKSNIQLIEPDGGVAIEEALAIFSVYDHAVDIVDYVGLLEGTDDDNSAAALGRATRVGKNWARAMKRTLIIAAQLSEQGLVRYARAMKEHADVLWKWIYTEENRESGIMEIDVDKGRNMQPITFQLGHDFSLMRLHDISEGGVVTKEQEREKKKDKKKGKGKKDDWTKNQAKLRRYRDVSGD